MQRGAGEDGARVAARPGVRPGAPAATPLWPPKPRRPPSLVHAKRSAWYPLPKRAHLGHHALARPAAVLGQQAHVEALARHRGCCRRPAAAAAAAAESGWGWWEEGWPECALPAAREQDTCRQRRWRRQGGGGRGGLGSRRRRSRRAPLTPWLLLLDEGQGSGASRGCRPEQGKPCSRSTGLAGRYAVRPVHQRQAQQVQQDREAGAQPARGTRLLAHLLDAPALRGDAPQAPPMRTRRPRLRRKPCEDCCRRCGP